MSEYDKLLEELDLLQKAYGDDDGDQKIAAAAEDDDDEHDEPDADNAGGPSDGDEDNEDDDEDFQPIAKSFAFQLDTGETVEAVDGTELLKSLSDSVAETDARLAKSFGEAVSLMKSMHGEIAGLKKQVAKLSGEGRGRKAVVNVHENAEPMAKSQSGLTPNDLMAKAQAAFAEGKLSGRELNEIDASLRMREAPNPSLIAKALA